MGYSLNAAGEDGAQARASVPAAVVSLLTSVVLVFAFGLTGACWSMVLRPAVRCAFLAPAVLRTFRPALDGRPQVGDIFSSEPAAPLRKAG
jgi:hypothetical protein